MITYVIPTRNRPAVLRRTLEALTALGDHAACGGAEAIVIDNASDSPPTLPPHLHPAVPLRLIRSERNIAAAARNLAAAQSDPGSGWIAMLDDDSYPLDLDFAAALREAPGDVLAVGAEIFLPRLPLGPADAGPPHESGGLPEVFIGCGVAIRRDAYLALGGYDARFDYYAEEYDLAARLLLAGGSVAFDRRFRVRHEKVTAGRDMNRILRRLVRNNAWVARRYAPRAAQAGELSEAITRYGRIARKERAVRGYLRGLADLAATLPLQRRTPMPAPLWDRFTGLAAARKALASAARCAPLGRTALIAPGKNAWAVVQAAREAGAVLADDVACADTLLVGTLSPGPMLDGMAAAAREFHGRRVVAPWEIDSAYETLTIAA